MHINALLCAVLVTALPVGIASASLIGADDFNSYANGATWGGLTGGTGWNADGGSATAWNQTYKHEWSPWYSSIDNGTGRMFGGSTVVRKYSASGNYKLGEGGKNDVYASFSVKIYDTTISYACFALSNSAGQSVAEFGWNGGSFGTGGSAVSWTASSVPLTTGTHNFIVHLHWGADAASSYQEAWIDDPTMSLAANHVSVTANTTYSLSTGIALYCSSMSWADHAPSFDNIVIGTALSDVSAVPEPAAVGMVGLGGLVLLTRRRS